MCETIGGMEEKQGNSIYVWWKCVLSEYLKYTDKEIYNEMGSLN